MKIINFIFLYFSISFICYFGSYAILHLEASEQKSPPTESSWWTQLEAVGSDVTLYLYIADLEKKMPLFFVYFPLAIKYVWLSKKASKKRREESASFST